MASITRTPSFAPSIIEVSSAPKHTGQARTPCRQPIATNSAVAKQSGLPRRSEATGGPGAP